MRLGNGFTPHAPTFITHYVDTTPTVDPETTNHNTDHAYVIVRSDGCIELRLFDFTRGGA